MTDIPVTPSSATIQAAYGKAREVQSVTTDTQSLGQSFGAMVEDAAQQAVQTVRTGDQVASAGLAGQANMQAVVEATMAMDSTVRVSVALRDKMVEAYREIIRMQI
ncbi:flagellar hook-basal body complex protein FliE [Aestuariivita sp.]|jgi:flagellar hook-basal body complex protein FliE|uniref:flagellar hook-basal body complex protein FliE n=1 Tax=Aestuariivita sp. TaxID=1872407 RepID=UPI00216F0014|nr:flagellar hook-basal body complex protein FliE [Aestuariivita sp.]MCE8008981.1 flagellar basal body protein [Aestuariivita sp.]